MLDMVSQTMVEVTGRQHFDLEYSHILVIVHKEYMD